VNLLSVQEFARGPWRTHRLLSLSVDDRGLTRMVERPDAKFSCNFLSLWANALHSFFLSHSRLLSSQQHSSILQTVCFIRYRLSITPSRLSSPLCFHSFPFSSTINPSVIHSQAPLTLSRQFLTADFLVFELQITWPLTLHDASATKQRANLCPETPAYKS
jgi:hypothetical protein